MLGGEEVEKEIEEKIRSWVGNGIYSFFKSKIRNLIHPKHGGQETEIKIFRFKIFSPSHLLTLSPSFFLSSVICNLTSDFCHLNSEIHLEETTCVLKAVLSRCGWRRSHSVTV